MALANVFKNGTYSNIHEVTYDKQQKIFWFLLYVYDSDSTMNLISIIQIDAGAPNQENFDTLFGVTAMRTYTDILNAAYEYIKSLDAYSACVDC